MSTGFRRVTWTCSFESIHFPAPFVCVARWLHISHRSMGKATQMFFNNNSPRLFWLGQDARLGLLSFERRRVPASFRLLAECHIRQRMVIVWCCCCSRFLINRYVHTYSPSCTGLYNVWLDMIQQHAYGEERAARWLLTHGSHFSLRSLVASAVVAAWNIQWDINTHRNITSRQQEPQAFVYIYQKYSSWIAVYSCIYLIELWFAVFVCVSLYFQTNKRRRKEKKKKKKKKKRGAGIVSLLPGAKRREPGAYCKVFSALQQHPAAQQHQRRQQHI